MVLVILGMVLAMHLEVLGMVLMILGEVLEVSRVVLQVLGILHPLRLPALTLLIFLPFLFFLILLRLSSWPLQAMTGRWRPALVAAGNWRNSNFG